MIKNFVYFGIIAVLAVAGFRHWIPDTPSIEGVTPTDISDSIAVSVESNYDGIIVTPMVTQPNQGSNSVVVQYMVVVNIDPTIFSTQPTTQKEAIRQQEAFESTQGALAELLSLSGKHLASIPTVVQVNIIMIFLDGRMYSGVVNSEDLNAIPQGSTQEEWLSVLALAPVVPVSQSLWNAIMALPEVQKVIEQKQTP